MPCGGGSPPCRRAFSLCSQDLHRPLLPQTEQIAAARAEYGFHCGTVALHQCIRHKGLYRPGKAAALHPPCSPAPCEDALAEGQRRRQALTLGRGGAVDVLTEFKGGVAARLHQPDKGGEVPRRERFSLGEGAGVLLKIVDGPQHGAVAAALPQPGQLLPEANLADLAQHLSAQTGRHCLHLLPDGRDLAGQLAVAGPGVGDAEGHPLRQDTVGVDLLDLRRSRVGKIGKEDTAHGAGQLVQQAAGLSEIGILRKLADPGQRRGIKAAAILHVENDRHPHLKGRRAGKPRAAEHIAGCVGIEAADAEPLCAEAIGDAPDEACRVGALALLRLGLGQVDDVQLVEAPGLDPDEAVLVPGRHRHEVKGDSARKAVAVLVVGVVAAQLGAPGGRIDLHLPPRPIVKFELVECRAVAAALTGKHALAAAVERGQRGVPPSRCDLVSELSAGCHPEPLPCAL